MMQIKRDFIGMFDVLKGILMLLIVLVHQASFGDVVMNFRIAAVLDSVLRYNADIMALFFLVSGYTLRREADWRAFARRQARQLLAPYFVLMVVCTGLRVMLHLCQGGFRIQDISTVVLAFLYGAVQPFELFGKVWVAAVGAFWFLPTLFVSGLLRQLLWRIEDRTRQALCLWGLVVLGVSFPSVMQIQLPWFLVQSCTALGFLEIGQQLRQKKLLFQRLPAVFTWAALACWIVMHCCSGAQIAANIWPFWVLDYAAAAAFGVVVLRVYLKTGLAAARLTGLLSYIGRYSLYFLWLHGTEMLVFPWDPTVRPPLLSLHLPGWLIFWGIFVIRVAFSVAGCAVISHIHGQFGQRAALRRSSNKEEVR